MSLIEQQLRLFVATGDDEGDFGDAPEDDEPEEDSEDGGDGDW